MPRKTCQPVGGMASLHDVRNRSARTLEACFRGRSPLFLQDSLLLIQEVGDGGRRAVRSVLTVEDLDLRCVEAREDGLEGLRVRRGVGRRPDQLHDGFSQPNGEDEPHEAEACLDEKQDRGHGQDDE